MPSIVRVTNLENGRSIIVRINDRGPFSRGRVIDMSKRGAELLQFKRQGTAKVKIQLLEKESRAVAAAAKRGESVDGIEIALNEGKSIEEAMGHSFTPKQDEIISAPIDIANAPTENTAAILTIEAEPLEAPIQLQQLQQPPKQPTLQDELKFVKQAPVTPSGIFVQAGAFSSPENAAAYAAQLSTANQSAKIYPVTVKGQTFHRVRIGPLNAVSTADQILIDLASQGHDKAIIVVE